MGESDPSDDDDLEYRVYLDERKLLIDAERESARSFDKAILTLAAGALGLSLTFVKEIAPSVRSGTVCLLVGAWAGFCVSMLCTLVSFLTSQAACSRQLKILEAEYFGDREDQSREISLKNWPSIVTNWLNVLSILTFIGGAVLLAVFSAVNIPFSR